MKWLIELVLGFFRIVFQTNMEHPYEEKEELKDVGTQPDNPDDAFCPSDW